MRILMLAPLGDVRGPMPMIATLLADALEALGCEVTIEPWGRCRDHESAWAKVPRSLADIARVRRRLSGDRFDVMLVQTSHEWRSLSRDLPLIVATRGHGARIVVQFHGGRTARLAAPGHPAFKAASRLLLGAVDGILVLSSQQALQAARCCGPGRVYMVSNPFVRGPFVASGPRDTASTSTPSVLFASRLVPGKGIFDAIEAIALLQHRLACRLVVAGDGAASAAVAARVTALGLDGAVTLTGHLGRDELDAAFRAADVFVLPTSLGEGFPTAIAEAMHAGLPIVATRAGGIPDHLREGANAIFVPPHAPVALAAALERLLRDPALRARMAAANRCKVRDFAPDLVARQVLRALDDVVGSADPPSARPARARAGVSGDAAAVRRSVDDIERAVHDAFVLADSIGWRSHDPYDLLLSPYLKGLPSISPLAARVAVQLGRRSGGRLRDVLRVATHEEPKAVADYLRAAALLSETSWAEPYVESLPRRLGAGDGTARDRRGWGVGFPCASRFVTAASCTPTAYITTAVTEALLDASDVLADAGALDDARAGCRFLSEVLGTFGHGGRRWLRYWAGSNDRIVNVQALAAGLFARAGARFADERLLAVADQLAETTVASQRADGSWPYSDDSRGGFVDGFHTGFVLQGLTDYAERRPDARSAVEVAIDAGFRYFRRRLVTPDGLPRGFSDGSVSLDPQNVAQCVQTLVTCGDGDRDVAAALALWRRAAERGRSPLSARRGAPAALRWALGPGVLAAAHVLRAAGHTPPAARLPTSPKLRAPAIGARGRG